MPEPLIDVIFVIAELKQNGIDSVGNFNRGWADTARTAHPTTNLYSACYNPASLEPVLVNAPSTILAKQEAAIFYSCIGRHAFSRPACPQSRLLDVAWSALNKPFLRSKKVNRPQSHSRGELTLYTQSIA